MRVVAGKYRGRKLLSPQGLTVRPTADRVKEALFNILQNKIPGCSALDLFAGSGALGIEAVSRGAKKVVFCDLEPKWVRANLEFVQEETAVLASDYASALRQLARSGERFDLIFLDPPYASDCAQTALNMVAEYGLLAKGGLAVQEHAAGKRIEVAGLKREDTRKYGRTELSFWGEESR